MLRKRGIDAVVVDRASAVGASWRGHYDRLHLHTVRWLSAPARACGSRAGTGSWVSRDGVVDYLERYARHHELDDPLRHRGRARRAEPDGGWRLRTRSGGDVEARHVVVATGYNNTPFVPGLPRPRRLRRAS